MLVDRHGGDAVTQRSGSRRLPQRGWTVARAFLRERVTERIRDAVARLESRAADALVPDGETPADRYDGLIVVQEAGNSALLCRFEGLLRCDVELRECVASELMPWVCELGGEPFVPFKDKLNAKLPGGGGYPPHQDIVAYRTFGPQFHLTAMIAVDEATVENGCLRVSEDHDALASLHPECVDEFIGGRPVFAHSIGGPEHGNMRSDIVERLTWNPVEMRPGDVLVFDSFVPHGSEPNRSRRSRRALFVTYSPARDGDLYEDYYAEKRRDPSNPKFHVSTPTRHAAQ